MPGYEQVAADLQPWIYGKKCPLEAIVKLLDRLIAVHADDMIVCLHCGKEHKVTEIKDMDGGNYTLQFVECGDQSLLVGVCGKRVVGVKSDVSGSVDL